MRTNTLQQNRKSSYFPPHPHWTSHTSPDQVLDTLQRSRKTASYVKKLFFEEDINSAAGLLVGALDLCLARIQSGITIKFSDWVRLAEVFHRDNLEVRSE